MNIEYQFKPSVEENYSFAQGLKDFILNLQDQLQEYEEN